MGRKYNISDMEIGTSRIYQEFQGIIFLHLFIKLLHFTLFYTIITIYVILKLTSKLNMIEGYVQLTLRMSIIVKNYL